MGNPMSARRGANGEVGGGLANQRGDRVFQPPHVVRVACFASERVFSSWVCARATSPGCDAAVVPCGGQVERFGIRRDRIVQQRDLAVESRRVM